MPNDFEVIKAFVLNGDNQSAHNHLMFHYRQDDEMRHALLTAIYEDPEVKYLYDTIRKNLKEI